MGMLDGRVALITGGARGQGRAHATTCAREGADEILLDIADQIDTAEYTMAGQGDLDEALDRRAIAAVANVRSQE